MVDKKQVRLRALQIVEQLIWQEIHSPTGFTTPGETGMFDELGLGQNDQPAIMEALESIRDELLRKMSRAQYGNAQAVNKYMKPL